MHWKLRKLGAVVAPVRHDAVWIFGNLRLSGHQHEGGRILTFVDDVNDMC